MVDVKLSERIDAIVKGYHAEEIFFKKERKSFPSHSAVIRLVYQIRELLFPGYFDNESAAGDTSRHLVGERLLRIGRVLETQVSLTLRFEDSELSEADAYERAHEIAEAFLDRLPAIQELVLKDSQAAFDGDPAARSREEVILTYPGVFAVFVYRVSHELFELGVPLIPRLMSEHAHSQTGIDIGPGAQIGEYFFVDHGTGVVIGETTVIGDHAKIYQGVTLGATSTRGGQKLAGVKRHPTLGDRVTVYSNASVCVNRNNGNPRRRSLVIGSFAVWQSENRTARDPAGWQAVGSNGQSHVHGNTYAPLRRDGRRLSERPTFILAWRSCSPSGIRDVCSRGARPLYRRL